MDVTWRIPLVGDAVEIVLYDLEPQLAEPLRDEVVAEALRLQRIFNLYDPESELSRLNAARTLRVSPEMREVLDLALRYCKATDGAYDVTRGKQFLARKRGLPLPPVHCSYRDVLVEGRPDGPAQVTLAHPGCLLDLGSVAKGYIADRLLLFLRKLGVESAFVDARGDMAIMGEHLEVIDVQHPTRQGTVRPFVLENRAVATSGGYRQYAGTPATSHIVGSSDLLSVTVIAPTLAEADALATALSVVGSGRAASVLPPYASAYLITADGKDLLLNGFEDLLVEAQLV